MSVRNPNSLLKIDIDSENLQKKFKRKMFHTSRNFNKRIKTFLEGLFVQRNLSRKRLKEFEVYFGPWKGVSYQKRRSSMRNNFRMLIYLKYFFPSGWNKEKNLL